MDAAYVSTITPQAQEIDEFVGDSTALGYGAGSVIPIEETYCSRMLSGQLANVVPDTRAEPAVRDLRATKRIGAYVGVSIKLADGTIHGTMCAASSTPRPGLGDEELRFMHVLARIVAEQIDRSRSEQARAAARLGRGDSAA
jgi:GAF domain-containing protein